MGCPAMSAAGNLMGAEFYSQYQAVRDQSVNICEPLEIEDYLIQPMEDASPPKWHLAHVTWFFETFLLKPFSPRYKVFSEPFEVLFNSYYNGVGPQHPRGLRGTLSRPTVQQVLDYRAHVDHHMAILLNENMSEQAGIRTTLGIHHEQQHQELLFTDIKYNLGNNPLHPCYHNTLTREKKSLMEMTFSEFAGGIYEIGNNLVEDFAFDNESPRHEVLVSDFCLANRLVTNAEYMEFVNDDGYNRPELWLSDAWSMLSKLGENRWQVPLYWHIGEDGVEEYTLSGLSPIMSEEPVCHVSAYEADAYARWKGYRLPTEIEWEISAQDQAVSGNFSDSEQYHPVPAHKARLDSLFGNLWEWTSSSYAPYPGFTPFEGQLGEYNGKFMANQLVLRGGSCVTPPGHIRASYRNFFYPPDRWQFSGIRLVSDG